MGAAMGDGDLERNDRVRVLLLDIVWKHLW